MSVQHSKQYCLVTQSRTLAYTMFKDGASALCQMLMPVVPYYVTALLT